MVIASMHLLPLSARMLLGPSRVSLKILGNFAVILQWRWVCKACQVVPWLSAL